MLVVRFCVDSTFVCSICCVAACSCSLESHLEPNAALHGDAHRDQGITTIHLTLFGCCAVYVFVSHRLFIVTNDLKSVVIPSAKVSRLLWRNFGMMAVAVVVLYVAAYLILRVLGINKRILAGI